MLHALRKHLVQLGDVALVPDQESVPRDPPDAPTITRPKKKLTSKKKEKETSKQSVAFPHNFEGIATHSTVALF